MAWVRTLVVVMLGGLASFPSATAAGPLAKGFIPLPLGPRGEPLVAVLVNGSGPFFFVLDTGSTHSSVTPALAARLGAPAVAMTTVASSVGRASVAVVRLDRLAAGPILAQNLLASVVPGAVLDPSGRILGILGQDVLARHRFTIDFTERWLAWDEDALETWSGSTSLALTPDRERFVVESRQSGSPLRLVPDSGAEGLVLYRSPQRPDLVLARTSETAGVETTTGRASASVAYLQELSLGPTTWTHTVAVVIEREDGSSADADGLLPLRLFGRVTFDAPRRQLIVSGR